MNVKLNDHLVYDANANRYIHVGTSNKSFLKMHYELRMKNVKNNAFFLYILDTELADIDPFDKNLSDYYKGKIIIECALNPWYFLREIVRIPVPGGDLQYDLNIANLATTWCLIGNINCYEVIPRQNYKTISACCFYLWIYLFSGLNSTMIFFNKSQVDCKKNLSRLKDIFFQLPEYMVKEFNIKNDANNIEQLRSLKRNNEIVTKPPGMNPEHADKIARGSTAQLIWYDELAFISLIDIIIPCAAPAASKAKELAILNKTPYSILITTTPNNIDSRSGAFAYKIRMGSLWFSIDFFDLGYAEIHSMLDVNNGVEFNFVYIEFSYKELGKDDRWLAEQKRELIETVKAKRELLLEWPMSNENSAFDEDNLDAIYNKLTAKENYIKIPIRGIPGLEIEIPSKISLILSRMVKPDEKMILGIDCATSETGLGDYNAIVVTDEFGKAIGILKNNRVDDFQWAAIVIYIMVYLLPNSIAIIERNSSGISLINKLTKAHKGFNLNKINLRHRVYKRPSKISKNSGEVNYDSENYYGINTNKGNRELMIRALRYIIESEPEKINMYNLFEEIKTLEVKNGKVQASSGHHDDLVMAYCIIHYVLREEAKFISRMLAHDYSNPASNKIVETILSPYSENINEAIENYEQNNKIMSKTGDIIEKGSIQDIVENFDTYNSDAMHFDSKISQYENNNSTDAMRSLMERIKMRNIVEQNQIHEIDKKNSTSTSTASILNTINYYDMNNDIDDYGIPHGSYSSKALQKTIDAILY